MFSDRVKQFIIENWDIENIMDEKFLDEFTKVLVSEHNLEGYLYGIYPDNLRDRGVPASYARDTRLAGRVKSNYYATIRYDKGIVDEAYTLFCIQNGIKKNKSSFNFWFFRTLLHETVHAMQELVLDSPELDNIESDILVFSHDIAAQDPNFYKIAHDTFTHERQANVGAYLTLRDVLSKIEVEDKDAMMTFMEKEIFDGYPIDSDGNYFPMFVFTNRLGYSKENLKIYTENNLSVQKRFELGLPLPNSELLTIRDNFRLSPIEGKKVR